MFFYLFFGNFFEANLEITVDIVFGVDAKKNYQQFRFSNNLGNVAQWFRIGKTWPKLSNVTFF